VGIDPHLCSSWFQPSSPLNLSPPSAPASLDSCFLTLSLVAADRFSTMFGLSLFVTLLLSVPAFTQVVTSPTLLPGTWSTGSGAVTTGPVCPFRGPSVELALKDWMDF